MTDADIDAAIAAEERALLERIGDEPGYFTQLLRLFGGRFGWINAAMMIAQILLFVAGVYAAWHFFGATDALTALHWGLPAVTLLLMSLMIKLALMPVLQVNRVLRALARLNLGEHHAG